MSRLTDSWITFAERFAGEGAEYLESTLKSAARKENGDASSFIPTVAETALRWRYCGYPVVSLSDKLAASLVLTRLPTEVPDLRHPWPVFMVVVPEWLGKETFFEDEVGVWVVDLGDGAFGTVITSVGFNVSSGSRQGKANQPIRYDSLAEFCIANERDCDEAGKAIARVVVGALCELNGVPPKRPRSVSTIKHERRGMPKAWHFQITRPVIVNFIEAARLYVRGERHGAFLQRLVRGHWQHYWIGSKGGERRAVLKHKEPYWQGDPEAPIALRAHVLQGSERRS